MKKRIKLTLRFLIIISLYKLLFPISYYLPSSGLGFNCWEDSPYIHSSDLVYRGIVYEFRGELNFNDFRIDCHYYLERATDKVLNAKTPKELAELARFHLFPESSNGERSPVVLHIYYYPEADSWIIRREFSDNQMFWGFPPEDIFAINRSTGEVVEYSRDRFTTFGLRVDRVEGWRRTAGVQQYYDLALLNLLGKSFMLLALPYATTFVLRFKKKDMK